MTRRSNARRKPAAPTAETPVMLMGETAEGTTAVEFGPIPFGDSAEQAQDFADSEGVTIFVRDHVSDEVLATYEPRPRDERNGVDPALVDGEPEGVFGGDPTAEGEAETETETEGEAEGDSAEAVREKGPGPSTVLAALRALVLDFSAMGDDASAPLAKARNVLREIERLNPDRLRKATKVREKSGVLREGSIALKCARLMARPDGVTPADLNSVSGWSKAPWAHFGKKWAAMYGGEFMSTRSSKGVFYFIEGANVPAAPEAAE